MEHLVDLNPVWDWFKQFHAATGIKLASALRVHPMGIAGVAVAGAATFIGIVVLRWPLAWVLLGVGGVSCVITWSRLGVRA